MWSRQRCVAALWLALLLMTLLCASPGGQASSAADISPSTREEQAQNGPGNSRPEQHGAAQAAGCTGSVATEPRQCDGATCAATGTAPGSSPDGQQALDKGGAVAEPKGTAIVAEASSSASTASNEGGPEQQPPATADVPVAAAVKQQAVSLAPDGQEPAIVAKPESLALAEGQAAAAAGTGGEQQPAVADGGAAGATAHAGEQPAAELAAAEEMAQVAVHDEQLHNFAMSKDGAKVLAANKEARKPHALLDDDSDTFLKNDCRADKWVMVELSQLAKVSRLELAQFELYSARVRDFEAWGRQSHPRSDGFGSEYARTLNSSQWQLLGNFTAEKAKGSQVFSMVRPLWVRYLLLRFLSQHGPEAICAVNGISLFGKSAAEELEDQLASASEEGLELGLAPELEPEPAVAAASMAAGASAGAGAPALLFATEQGIEAPANATAAADAGTGTPVAAEAGLESARQPLQQPQVQQQAAAAVLTEQQKQQHHQQQQLLQGADEGVGVATGNVSEAKPAGAAPGATDVTAAASSPSPSSSAGDIDAPAIQHPSAATAVGPDAGAVSSRSGSSSIAGSLPGSEAGNVTERQHAQGENDNASVPNTTALPPPTQPSNNVPAGSSFASDQTVTASNTGDVTAPAAASNVSAAAQAQVQQVVPSNASSNGTATAACQASQQQEPVVAAVTPTDKAAAPAAQPAAGTPAAVPPPPASLLPPAGAPIEGLELPRMGLGGKAKGGGSVYDLLVQEIRTAKLHQKLLAKGVMELQHNTSGQYAELAGDIASLSASLAKISADHNGGDEELAARVDVLVKAHLLQVASQMLGLQAALGNVAKQQQALLCFLAMMGGVLALNGTHFSEHWPRAKYAVLLLAAANGLVGVVLQLQGGIARRPLWVQALPRVAS